MRVDLPDDGWAELKEPSDLKAKDKIAVQRAVVFNMTQENENANSNGEQPTIPVSAGIAEDMIMAMLSRIITSWSLPAPMPVTKETLEDLPLPVYTALSDAIEPHLKAVRSGPNRRMRTG